MTEPTRGGKVYDTAADEFTSIIQRLQTAIQNKNDMTTEHASEWKRAKEKGIHNEALKLCLKLHRQDTAKTADFLRAFDAYCDALGIRSQTDLFEQEQQTKANEQSIASASDRHESIEPEFAE